MLNVKIPITLMVDEVIDKQSVSNALKFIK